MKGRYCDYENNRQEPKLQQFLEDKVLSVRKRIKQGTGVDVEPIYYSAGFKEEGEEQCRPYNLSKLIYFIIKFTPKEKKLFYVDNINQDQQMWKDNDGLNNYRKEISKYTPKPLRYSSSTGGGCYITIAVCKEFNKLDNCYELTLLRKFRNG